MYSSRLRWTLLVCGGLFVAALALAVWFWLRPPPNLPGIALEEADPEIVEAITPARQDVIRKPSSASAWGHLGMVLRAHDFGVEANRCLAEAERLDPKDYRWPYLQGLTLLLSDVPAGIACLQRAVERGGDRFLAPRLRLAEALLDVGRLDEADQHLQRAAELDPEDLRLYMDCGRLALLREDWPAALSALSRCVNDEHARRSALILRAQVYRRLGQEKQAAEDVEQADRFPDDARWPDPVIEEVLRLQRGLASRMTAAASLRAASRLDEAAELLEETSQKYPKALRAWLELAEVRRQQGRADLAEEACCKAVQADPEATQAWFKMGCYQAEKQPAEAAESFRRALRLKPDHALAHYNLGYCLEQLGNLAEAADEYSAALRCKPDYLPARTALQKLEKKPVAEK
jgi:tetratricopeptide (TPR) repeat protein